MTNFYQDMYSELVSMFVKLFKLNDAQTLNQLEATDPCLSELALALSKAVDCAYIAKISSRPASEIAHF